MISTTSGHEHGDQRTGFTCGVEAQHEQAHFARAKDLAHHLGNLVAHVDGVGCRAQRYVLERGCLLELPTLRRRPQQACGRSQSVNRPDIEVGRPGEIVRPAVSYYGDAALPEGWFSADGSCLLGSSQRLCTIHGRLKEV